MSKVFGIGWAKTGTTTLGRCFQMLGYRHQGQDLGLVRDIGSGDLSRIRVAATAGESFEDWPWILLYRELDRTFPGSRFVLTVRDMNNWIRSYANMLRNQGEAPEDLNAIRRIIYGRPFPKVTRRQLIERYQKHNRDVIRYFRDRPDDLLIIDWEQTHGWHELCLFLQKPVPDEPFPHENRGHYFP
jgi:hypothetical protein